MVIRSVISYLWLENTPAERSGMSLQTVTEEKKDCLEPARSYPKPKPGSDIVAPTEYQTLTKVWYAPRITSKLAEVLIYRIWNHSILLNSTEIKKSSAA